MVEKTIEVSGKEVKFRSSAAVPRLYRAKFKRDIFKDFSKLEKSYKDNADEGEAFAIEDLEIFENVAYIMAYHADPTIPGTIEDWLDQFDMFSIYQVLPEILEMWGTNMMTDVAFLVGHLCSEQVQSNADNKRSGRKLRFDHICIQHNGRRLFWHIKFTHDRIFDYLRHGHLHRKGQG